VIFSFQTLPPKSGIYGSPAYHGFSYKKLSSSNFYTPASEVPILRWRKFFDPWFGIFILMPKFWSLNTGHSPASSLSQLPASSLWRRGTLWDKARDTYLTGLSI
jgi:hypothetical protein